MSDSLKSCLKDIAICEKLQEKMHIVNDLKINMLIESNILSSQKMHLNYEHERLIIESCKEMIVLMMMTLVKNKMNRVIRALSTTTILARSSIMISMRLRDN